MPMTTFYSDNQIYPPTDNEVLEFYNFIKNELKAKSLYIHEIKYKTRKGLFSCYEKRYCLLKHLFGNEYQILCSVAESLSKKEILVYLLGFINGNEWKEAVYEI
jgi:hypothetical protein